MIVFCIDFFYPPKMFGAGDGAGSSHKQMKDDDEVRESTEHHVMCRIRCHIRYTA